ncbi:hypothetical protein Hanom_Chr02g00137561 [Helianthus anomalus]
MTMPLRRCALFDHVWAPAYKHKSITSTTVLNLRWQLRLMSRYIRVMYLSLTGQMCQKTQKNNIKLPKSFNLCLGLSFEMTLTCLAFSKSQNKVAKKKSVRH